MQFNKFTTKAQESIFKAQEIAGAHAQFQVDTVHLLDALIRQEDSAVLTVLYKLGVNVELLKMPPTIPGTPFAIIATAIATTA